MSRIAQDRAVRTREALIISAAEIFDEFGYAGAGVTKILERAGVTTGAMYFHFKSKSELATAVMSAQQQSIEPPQGSHGLQRLVDITLVWAVRLRTDPLLRAGVRLSVEQGSFGLQDATAFLNWRDAIVECLDVARDEGDLLADADPHAIAEFLVGACTGVQLYSQLISGREDLLRRTVGMWRMLLPGIATPQARQRVLLDADRGYAV
ncbi:ScbR family autoregulator-binding transcription factor [Streptomyces pratensis]|uniref:ScbR family autoregulator-binding transcription factor n=1 Tax=Streptomyces pratensis TaxID=1169025 RepID=UPI003017BEA5